MARLNIVLLAALALSALALVTSQHEARKTHIALEQAQSEGRGLDASWNHLRIQQTSLAAAALIDARARQQLGMDSPPAHATLHVLRDSANGEPRLATVSLPPGSRGPARPATASVSTAASQPAASAADGRAR
jgi:cell division protein FtsL